VPLTASVGWAVLAQGDEPDDLVRRADIALYAAKSAGRNRVGSPATLPRRT
jgi:GGDEF domain-containing protein